MTRPLNVAESERIREAVERAARDGGTSIVVMREADLFDRLDRAGFVIVRKKDWQEANKRQGVQMQ